MTGAMGGWMVLWIIVSLAVVALLAMLIVRASATTGRDGAGEARRILDARLARGEIDPQDYRERLALIGG
jgi:uncharacterized membrane protein